MMFGTREPFDYFQCSSCGCLQIAKVPIAMERFYPPDYYSFQLSCRVDYGGVIRRWLRKQRCRTALFGSGYKLNALLKHFVEYPRELFATDGALSVGEIVQKCGLRSFAARCLDVGCGAQSQWLSRLAALGFENLFGVDPYIDSDKRSGDVTIYRRQLAEMDGAFDLITFHHSLEHMDSQLDVLRTARSLLKPTGVCLVRIPVVSSLVWERYGVNWVELDAPRHLYLHSVKSITEVAARVGLDVFDVVHDSLPFEFYGSEQYVRDIPLNDPASLWVDDASTIFSEAEKAAFADEALRVNSVGRGGRAGFYMRPL